ncbi:response regulator [Chloroflexota bacterium]
MAQHVKRKILVADDEPTIRQVVRKRLSKDYVVIEAENGQQAVDMARTEKPDAILMDFQMPVLDGLGACYIIKADAETKAIPVIIVSARGHELDQQYANDMGADAYITKPFEFSELLNTIKRFLPTLIMK